MIDPDSLNIWYEDKLVGHLWRNTTSAVGFRYAKPGSENCVLTPVFLI